MLSLDEASSLLHSEKRGRLEASLILLAIGDGGKSVAAVKKLARDCGLRNTSSWNFSDIFGKSKGLALLRDGEWVLSGIGRNRVSKLAGLNEQPTVVKKVTANVRQYLPKVGSADARDFIAEAVACFEASQYRAAVILSWVGAISLLQDRVVRKFLPEFNAAMKAREPRWKDARDTEELGKVRERDFLEVLAGIGCITKSVKQILQDQCLSLRNSCGHPTKLKIGENHVAAHLDTLILNVYATA
ncbi:MAG: hypothetical protein AB7H70_06635 [Rhodospirillaceae bacterium]